MKVHLDTDLGGDIDDLAALALLLAWPGVEITGITTVTDDGGRRAGYTRHALALAGHDDIPVAAGADVTDGYCRYHPQFPDEALFWPEPVSPAPGKLDAALALLRQSIDTGATVIGIGQCTNLRLLDERYPGLLRETPLYLVGGFVSPPRPTRSVWGNDADYNFQLDPGSALHVLTRCAPTLVPLHVTTETTLRRSDLPRLSDGGPLSRLLAHQAAAFDAERELEPIDRVRSTDLPDDFINHLYDPLACAVALGWDGAEIEELPLWVGVEDGLVCQRNDPEGIPSRVVTRVDGSAFDTLWLDTVRSV